MRLEETCLKFTLHSQNYQLHSSENVHAYSFNPEEWPESIFTAVLLL